MTSKPRFVICGYYGFENLGDELILNSIIGQLKGQFKNCEIRVLSHMAQLTEKKHQVKTINRWNLFQVLKALWWGDVFLFGGGGLFQNETSNRSLLYYLTLLGLGKLICGRVWIYALGVEKINGLYWDKIIKFLLNGDKVYISVRDQESSDLLVQMGIPGEKIHLVNDPVFLSPISAPQIVRYGTPGHQILFVPRFPCPPEGRAMYQNIIRILSLKKIDAKVSLFHPSVEEIHAQAPEWSMLEKISLDSSIRFSFEKISNEVQKFDWIISTRFHALVLAAIHGKPFIGLGNPHKVARICRQFQMPFLGWDSSWESLVAAMEKIDAMRVSPAQASEMISRVGSMPKIPNFLIKN
ncbi:MAG: polysaccharide pyruvyl transferase family protein [Elusimicrobiota bacterium]